MFGIDQNVAGIAGALGGIMYLLLFLLLLSANIALWKYIFKGGSHYRDRGHGDEHRERR